MERLLDSIMASLKTIRAWQAVAALVVLFGAAALTFIVYGRAGASDGVDLQEDQQIIPVQYGDLVNQVSTSGNLAFPNRDILRFGAQGKVARILVEEGEEVEAGQPLAEIDEATAAGLRLKAAQARVDLDAAQREWDDITNPAGSRVSEARVKVSNDELKLQDAMTSLADLPLEHQDDLLQARQSAAGAALELDKARDSLSNFPGDFRQDLATARLLKANREAALEDARNALADFDPGYQVDLAGALQARSDAKLALQARLEDLAAFRPDYALQLNQARQEQARAQQALEAAQRDLDDFEPGHLRQAANAQQSEVNARERWQSTVDALDRYEQSNSSRLTPLRERKAELTVDIREAQTSLENLTGEGAGQGFHAVRLRELLGYFNDEMSDIRDSLAAVEKLEAEVQVNRGGAGKGRGRLGEVGSRPGRSRGKRTGGGGGTWRSPA